MSRLLFAGVLLASLALGSGGRALAFDYDDPVVPSEFLLNSAAPVAAPAEGGLTLLRRQESDVPRPAADPAAAAEPRRVPAYGSYGCEDGGGRAIWNYNAC